MARPLRIEFPGAFYHVFSRGNERKNIVRAESDYKLFLQMLEECCKRFNVLVHSYCLMANHFHLLLQTREANLSKFMKRLLGVYTMRFNHRYDRVGHLFQGRYKSILVDQNSYLLELSRYIHLNPCKANVEQNPVNYAWSSMRYFLGGEKKPSFLDELPILSQFESQRAYQMFVMNGLRENINQDLFEKVVGGVFLGSNEFIQKFQSHLKQSNLHGVSRRKELIRISQKQKRGQFLRNRTDPMGRLIKVENT